MLRDDSLHSTGRQKSRSVAMFFQMDKRIESEQVWDNTQVHGFNCVTFNFIDSDNFFCKSAEL